MSRKGNRQLRVLERCDAASRELRLSRDKVIVDSIVMMLTSAKFNLDEPFEGSTAVDILSEIYAMVEQRERERA